MVGRLSPHGLSAWPAAGTRTRTSTRPSTTTTSRVRRATRSDSLASAGGSGCSRRGPRPFARFAVRPGTVDARDPDFRQERPGTDGPFPAPVAGRMLGEPPEATGMPIRVEAYTAGGVATGVVAQGGSLREALDGAGDLQIESAEWLPLDGSGGQSGDVTVLADDLLLLVGDEAETGPVHAQWHTIELDAGPYRLVGEMPTMPGFDPGRALARPTGEFVFLRDARISLIGREDAGEASATSVLVNRYTVDRIKADLMLGFFFPGAEMVLTGAAAVQAAAAAAQAAAVAAADAAADLAKANGTAASSPATVPATPQPPTG